MELLLTDTLSLKVRSGHDNDNNNNEEDATELGCRLWTAAVLLCGFLRSNASLVQHQRVLEIGAGLGACGFCCAALGAASVTLTDCGWQTLQQLAETLVEYHHQQQTRQQLANTQEPQQEPIQPTVEEGETGSSETTMDNKVWDLSNVSIRRHLWEEDLECLLAQQEHRPMDTIHHWSKIGSAYRAVPSLPLEETFDVVIGSDLLYFSSQEESLLAAIRLRLRRPHGVAVLLQTMRTNSGAVFDRFLHNACAVFQVQVQDISPAEIAPMIATIVNNPNHVSEMAHTTGFKMVTLRHLERS